MSIRQLCKETARLPIKALFYFTEESKTGIVQTRIIVDKNVNIEEGKMVTVNWAGKKVRAEILPVSGKCSLNFVAFVSSLYRIEHSKTLPISPVNDENGQEDENTQPQGKQTAAKNSQRVP